MRVEGGDLSEGVKESLKAGEEWMSIGRTQNFMNMNLKCNERFSPALRDEVNRLFTVANIRIKSKAGVTTLNK